MEEEIVLMEENDIEEINIEEENYSGKPYKLPIASETTLGGIKVGENLTIDEDGTLNAQAGGSDVDLTEYVKEEELKTINGQSLVGEGNIVIEGGSGDIEVAEKQNNMLTASLPAHVEIVATNTAQKITSFVEIAKIGDKFSVENGVIRIGKGVSKIKVSYNAVAQATVSTTRTFTYIMLNDSAKSQESYYFSDKIYQTGNAIPSMLLDVKEGDEITLMVYGYKGNKIMGATTFTYWTQITVEEYHDNNLVIAKGVVENLDDYAKTTDIPKKVSELENDSKYLTSIPLEYITETELSEKKYVTESFVTNKIAEAELSGGDVDLSGYATKDELNNKANTSDIPTKVSQLSNDKGYLTEVPSEYVTETELNAKGYLTKHQDISHLATKDELHTHNNKEILDSISQENIDKWNAGGNKPCNVIVDAVEPTNGEPIWVKQGRNLCNTKGMLTGYKLDSSGTVTNDYNYWGITGYIEVEPNTMYTMSGITYGSTSRFHVWYDENKNVISSIARFLDSVPSKTYTSPTNAKYIRFTLCTREDDDERTTFQFEIGKVATSYVPFIDEDNIFVRNTKGTYEQLYEMFPVSTTGGVVEETDPTVPQHVKAITQENIDKWNAKSDFSGSYNDLTNKPTIPTVPTNISSFTNDSGYINATYIEEHKSELKGDKGDNGYTPIKGTDYWTQPDKEEIKEYVKEVISNIGGGTSNVNIEPLIDDIPKVFINGSIPIDKTNVLAELTYISKTEKFNSYIKIKCQGSSSMDYPKKNFTINLYANEERSTKLNKNFKGWGEQSKFCLKANYIDHSHSRNIISANLWTEVVSSRTDYDNLPVELKTSPKNGAIDGFPIKVYTNGTYQGIYTWNIPKDDWLFNMDSDNTNHILLCGENNTDGYYGENACNFRSFWSGVNEDDWSVEVGTNSENVKNSLNNLISCVKDTNDDTFKSTINNYLDLQSAIDYYIHQYVICGLDGLAKNLLLATYNGAKWYCSAYDMDSTFGLYWNGSYFVGANYKCPEEYQEKYSLLWERIANLFSNELKDRYFELRKSVYSIENMFTKFERFTDLIGKDLYEEDVTIYSEIPSANTNNITQIRNYIKERLKYVDTIMNGGELPDDEIVEEILVENYKPNGESFVYTVNNFNSEKDYLEISMDLSSCQNSDENILSIGNGIANWSAYNFHGYYTKSSNAFGMYALTSSGEAELETNITNYKLIVKFDKNGIYFDGVLADNSTSGNAKELIDYLMSQSSFQVGSQEGANRSNATYNYIKVVKG